MPSDNRKSAKYLRAAVEHLEQAIELLSNPPPTADKEIVEKALKLAAALDPRYLEYRERQGLRPKPIPKLSTSMKALR
jgi:hypothetical protein